MYIVLVLGSFLFFSTYGAELEQQNVGEVLYVSSISPNFPPTSPKTNDINSTAYKSCLVRLLLTEFIVKDYE